MRSMARLGIYSVGLCLCTPPLAAQKGNQTAPASSGSGAPAGLNFPASTLKRLVKPPDRKDFRKYEFLCYSLVPVISTNAPFSLQRGARIDAVPCKAVDADHPLNSGKKIMLVLDTSAVDLSRVQSLNVNITFVQGTTISQRAVRPSISGSIPFTALSTSPVYYLLVSDKLTGDAIPQLSVSLLYDPPVQGQQWTPHTIFPPGSIVAGPTGHFFLSQSGGVSGGENPSQALQKVLSDDIKDNECHWSPYGIAPPSGGTSVPWLANNNYSFKDVVYVPSVNLFYIETANPAAKCTSSGTSPFPTTAPVATEEPKPKPTELSTTDGAGANLMQWGFVQNVCPVGAAAVPSWQPKHDYAINERVCEGDRLYRVIVPGKSTAARPEFQNPDSAVALPTWVDIGVYPPSSAVGALAAEMQTNAITMPLAQVHALAFYNVDSGVLVSTIRIPSYTYTTPTTINNGTPVKSGSTLLIDPVVTLTRYIWGFDPEAKEHVKDWRPGISLSFSLASPTSNFYIGGSSEFIRYVQVDYGFAVAKQQRLVPGAFAATSSTTPATSPVFAKGGYVGLSFNLTDFVKSLVKGN